MIDTESGKEDRDRTVVISGDRISAVRDSKDLKPSKGAKVFEGTNRYLIPGLWDMHVHFRGSINGFDGQLRERKIDAGQRGKWLGQRDLRFARSTLRFVTSTWSAPLCFSCGKG